MRKETPVCVYSLDQVCAERNTPATPRAGAAGRGKLTDAESHLAPSISDVRVGYGSGRNGDLESLVDVNKVTGLEGVNGQYSVTHQPATFPSNRYRRSRDKV
jgi:hypothetical protein